MASNNQTRGQEAGTIELTRQVRGRRAVGRQELARGRQTRAGKSLRGRQEAVKRQTRSRQETGKRRPGGRQDADTGQADVRGRQEAVER